MGLGMGFWAGAAIGLAVAPHPYRLGPLSQRRLAQADIRA